MLDLAKVTAVHPEANAVDLLFLHDGSAVPMVQCAGFASTRAGFSGLIAPDVAPGGKLDLTPTNTNDVIALVDYTRGGLPIVVDFLAPQVNQLAFKEGRRIYRDPSDVYVAIDDAGNTEIRHPSGTYLRIGATAAHEDLTGKDFDGQWKIDRNLAAPVHVQIQVANAGVVKATLHVDPTGNVSLTNAGTLSAVSVGDATLQAPTINLTGNLNVNGSTVFTGSVHANGHVIDETHVHKETKPGAPGEFSGVVS